MSRTCPPIPFLTRLKQFLFSSDELPDFLNRASPASGRGALWDVKGSLVQHTAFGILSAQSAYQVRAPSEPEAIRLASAEIRKFYPGYAFSSLTAQPAQEA
ncbi:hypothetical protein [Prosthecobacter fusiformis]|nr:hypothetical protein [Prosthecobacter fusiformis]